MKKILIILSIWFFASCATYSPVVNFLDYSAYTQEGIFLTESNSVSFRYEPVGSISVLLYSGYAISRQSMKKENKPEDDIYYNSPISSNYQNATIQEALRLTVEKAKSQGADAVINLKYQYIQAFKNVPSGWYVSGMAVKII